MNKDAQIAKVRQDLAQARANMRLAKTPQDREYYWQIVQQCNLELAKLYGEIKTG